VTPYHLAIAYVGLGSIDAAFELLEQAWLDRDPAIAAMHAEPRGSSRCAGSAAIRSCCGD
jgi:hypothetical protein